jgi:hypothetical protein
MSEPWDMPPRASIGDPTDDALYQWLGRALCAWEEYEVHLTRLFAVFSDLPIDAEDTYRLYIEGNLNFSGRLQKIEKTGEKFFKRFPDQTDEGNFTSILARSKGFADRRNDIAHSVVVPGLTEWDASKGAFDEWIRDKQLEEWWLLPPEYMAKKYTSGMRPAYAYVSANLSDFWQAFRSLIPPVQGLAFRLYQRHGA